MTRIKRLATESPLTFGLAVTLAFILMVIIASVLANRWPAESPGWFFANAIGRVVSIALVLALLAQLGWLGSAGLTRPGRWPIWLIVLPLLAYFIAVPTVAMTGGFNFRFLAQGLPGVAALFLMTHAFFEEVVFRGLVMVAFVNIWDGTTRGLTRSVLVSSLIFAGMHLIGVLGGNPLLVVLLQSVGAFFQGILYGALLLSGGTIYPVAILHGLANLAAYVMLTANPSAGTTPSAWLLQSTLMFPLAILGVYILRGISPRIGRIVTFLALALTMLPVTLYAQAAGAARGAASFPTMDADQISTFVEQNILKPLGMARVTAYQPLPEALQSDMATGYLYAGGKFIPQGLDLLAPPAAGAMSAAGSDMARFMIAHLQNGQYGEARILQEQTARLMHSSLYKPDPRLNGLFYGFWEMSQNGVPIYGHTGDLTAFRSILALFPDHYTLVALSAVALVWVLATWNLIGWRL